MATFVDSALEAVQAIGSGEYIWSHSMAASPVMLLDALAQHAMSLQDVTLMQLHLENATSVASPALDGHLRNRCFFAGAETRTLINDGLADYVPIFLSEIPKLFRRGQQKLDTALVQVSSPDRHGNCSLGISVEATAAACDMADKIIAHVNPAMPRTHGDFTLHVNDIDYAFVQDAPLITHDVVEPDPVKRKIGEHIATLVEDGACLQMGIGGIPDAALSCLTHHKDLGVHTEMFSDGVVDLYEHGVITNAHKKIGRGKLITGFVMGSQSLYNFVDDNSDVRFADIEWVNNPVVIAKNSRVTSINSAIQIDLSGQVCADSIGAKIYSGVGGQLDFVLGASFSEGGRSIIALPSTARGGTVSRLVPTLAVGSGVVTTRAHVHYVVTEHGVAELRGGSVAERVRDLIAIAHPDFQESLSREARDVLNVRV